MEFLVFHWVTLSLGYVMLTVGLTISLGISKIVNIAHGSFYMLGAYLFVTFLEVLHIPLSLSMLASVVITGLLGGLIEAKLYRPLGGVIAPSIICMSGVLLVMEGIVVLIFGPDIRNVPSVFTGRAVLGGITVGVDRMAIAFVALLLSAGLFYFLKYTQLGKAFTATAQDREAATLMGINVAFVSSLSMGIGVALAALAGIQLTAIYYLSPFVSYAALMTALLIVCLGGLGSILGTIFGAFAIGFCDSFGAEWVGTYYQLLGLGLVSIILLLRGTMLKGSTRD